MENITTVESQSQKRTVDRGDAERLPTTAFGWDGAVDGNRDESHTSEAASQSGVGK